MSRNRSYSSRSAADGPLIGIVLIGTLAACGQQETRARLDPEVQQRMATAGELPPSEHATIVRDAKLRPDPYIAVARSELRHSDSVRRIWSAYLLKQIGPRAGGALPDLLKAAQDGDHSVRSMVAGALVAIAPRDDRVLTTLATLSTDAHRITRYVACRALGEVQTSGPAAEQALTRCLEDEDPEVRVVAAASLTRRNRRGPEVVSALIAGIDGPGGTDALRGLADISPIPLEALPAIIRVLESRNLFTMPLALDVLERMGAAAGDALPLLRALRAEVLAMEGWGEHPHRHRLESTITKLEILLLK
jgi:HEAT repeat protein